MKRIAGVIAALLLTGAAVPAFAQTSAPPAAAAHAAPIDCTGPAFTWRRLGGDPFATNEAEAMRKLPEALAHAVALGCMPQRVADAFAAQIRENPEGTRVTIVPGAELAFMESGKHPILNVTVGRTVVSAGTGLVVSIEAKAWRARDTETGIEYQWMMPFVCFNWSLMITQPAVPPPPPPARVENDCVVDDIQTNGLATDAYIHAGARGPEADDACSAWRRPGETEWHSWHECPDLCSYEAVKPRLREELGNDRITATLKIPVTDRGIYQVRHRRVARDEGMLYCLELSNGSMSDGVIVAQGTYRHYDEINQDIAVVFRTLRAIPATWGASDRLYFRFSP